METPGKGNFKLFTYTHTDTSLFFLFFAYFTWNSNINFKLPQLGINLKVPRVHGLWPCLEKPVLATAEKNFHNTKHTYVTMSRGWTYIKANSNYKQGKLRVIKPQMRLSMKNFMKYVTVDLCYTRLFEAQTHLWKDITEEAYIKYWDLDSITLYRATHYQLNRHNSLHDKATYTPYLQYRRTVFFFL